MPFRRVHPGEELDVQHVRRGRRRRQHRFFMLGGNDRGCRTRVVSPLARAPDGVGAQDDREGYLRGSTAWHA